MTRTSHAAIRLGVASDLHHTANPAGELVYHNPFDVPGVLTRLRTAIAWFAREQVDAVVLAGDLTQSGDSEALTAVLQTVADGWAGPAFVVAGNHDVLRHNHGLAQALARLGTDRIALARPEGDLLGGIRVAGLDVQATGQTRAIAGWEHDPVVLISHFPMLSRAHAFAERALKYAGDHRSSEPLVDALLARQAPTVIVHGHLHARDSHQHATLLQLSVAALVEPPFEATIIDIVADRARTTVRRRARALRTSSRVRAPVLAPADETRTLPALIAG